ncbi:hypothetical protein ST47_g9051 [Ascochyta rabiei]|uniref:Uncharacterized protein n=1 Tax=Didymella rabiei TaxID=5454 RepID=A0A162YAX3_DIDRA|nr:hypothetical protein ST47_g9051 [Ascochyta rabiei]
MQLMFKTISLVALVFWFCGFVAALPPTSSYNYTFDELRPQPGSQGSFRQPYFRFKIFFRKNTSITEKFLHSHWKTVHADLTISDPDAGVRLLRYTQFHQDEEHRKMIQPLIHATHGRLAVSPYDGVAEFLTKDYGTFEKFLMQIFINPVMVADQQSFADDSTAMHVMAGYDNLIFGDAIDALNGANGILPSDPRLVHT